MTIGGANDDLFYLYGGRGDDPPDRDPPEPPDGPSWQHMIEIRGLATGRRKLPPRTLLAPALRLLARLGGAITFDQSYLRPYGIRTELTELGAAIVSYAALLTYLFDDPRLYKSGRLRHLGWRLAEEMGILPLRQRLHYAATDGDEKVPWLELSEIDLGSAKFLQTVKIVAITVAGIIATGSSLIGAAADGPDAWEHAEEIYLPAVMKVIDVSGKYIGDAAYVTGVFLDEYFGELGEILEITTIPIGPTPTPKTPMRAEPYPIRTKKIALRRLKDKG